MLHNAALEHFESGKVGIGIDVIKNKQVDMVEAGIIDPVLVTKNSIEKCS